MEKTNRKQKYGVCAYSISIDIIRECNMFYQYLPYIFVQDCVWRFCVFFFEVLELLEEEGQKEKERIKKEKEENTAKEIRKEGLR